MLVLLQLFCSSPCAVCTGVEFLLFLFFCFTAVYRYLMLVIGFGIWSLQNTESFPNTEHLPFNIIPEVNRGRCTMEISDANNQIVIFKAKRM